jgi:hypothetical protein
VSTVPTYGWLARFRADFERLTPTQQEAILRAVEQFVEDLRRTAGFRQGLRVKGVQGAGGIYEMTWAPDGRATFEYSDEVNEDETHVVWRRVGTHGIFTQP